MVRAGDGQLLFGGDLGTEETDDLHLLASTPLAVQWRERVQYYRNGGKGEECACGACGELVDMDSPQPRLYLAGPDAVYHDACAQEAIAACYVQRRPLQMPHHYGDGEGSLTKPRESTNNDDMTMLSQYLEAVLRCVLLKPMRRFYIPESSLHLPSGCAVRYDSSTIFTLIAGAVITRSIYLWSSSPMGLMNSTPRRPSYQEGMIDILACFARIALVFCTISVIKCVAVMV